MWRLTTPDGRIAWFCGERESGAEEMAAELFPGVDGVVVEPAGKDDLP